MNNNRLPPIRTAAVGVSTATNSPPGLRWYRRLPLPAPRPITGALVVSVAAAVMVAGVRVGHQLAGGRGFVATLTGPVLTWGGPVAVGMLVSSAVALVGWRIWYAWWASQVLRRSAELDDANG